MKRMLMLSSLSVLVMVFSAEGCAAKKKKKPAATTPPLIVGSPTPPPQEPPIPTDPSKPEDPGTPNPIPTPSPIPIPSPSPSPLPSPNPIPMPVPLPLDRYGNPIIPAKPVVADPHIILTTGVVMVVRTTPSVQICQDDTVAAYYIPCNTGTGLYCWEWFRPTCGYFICQRW